LQSAGIALADDLVFPANGSLAPNATTLLPMDSADIFKCVREGVEQLCGPGSSRRGPQTLRNTFAVRNLLGGRKPEDIRQWMGLKTDFTLIKLRERIEQCCRDEPV
jgi:hypothetical protein